MRANGSTLTFVRDALGSVRAEVTDSGVVAKAFRYAAYGEIVQPNANVPTLLGFTGELRDPSGLIYLRARWYDPGTGRFTSRDPYRGVIGINSSLTGYSYAHANPLSLTDPLGLDPGAHEDHDYYIGGCLIYIECIPVAVPAAEAQMTYGGRPWVQWGPFGPVVTLTAKGRTNDGGKQRSVETPPGGPPGSGENARRAAETVGEVLARKQGRVHRAPLAKASPSLSDIREMSMSEVERRAKGNEVGFRTILKLLRDRRFDR